MIVLELFNSLVEYKFKGGYMLAQITEHYLIFQRKMMWVQQNGKMEELEAEQIPLLTLPPPPPPQPPPLSPPPSPPSVSTQPVPTPLPSFCHTDCKPLLTLLPKSFTEEEQDKFLTHLLKHIKERSQGASAEEFCDDQLRMLDYININASSYTGISCCAQSVQMSY
jgi:hypothetical protein